MPYERHNRACVSVLSLTRRPDEEPRNGPTGSKPAPIQNEELASGVPVSGPCSWHEPIPQWVVVLQISPQRFEEFLLEGFVVPQLYPQRLNARSLVAEEFLLEGVVVQELHPQQSTLPA